MTTTASDSTYGLLGQSQPVASIRRLIEKASRNRLPVLLLGESGTGKEVVARAIHQTNPQGQFVPIDCGSLVGTLMESELFGHTRGSFSGATEHKKGLVELADGGTAFFDEIGDLPLEMQVKLLRLIQEREFRPVGALHWRKVELRIIAATHRDLKAEVAAGRFRQDLYYRLNVIAIHLPPLRDRKQDIPMLVDYFIHQCRAQGLPDFCAGDDMMRALMAYDWPGNIRELKHCIDRMVALHSEGASQPPDLPSALQYLQTSSSRPPLQNPDSNLHCRPFETLIRRQGSGVISIPDSEKQTIMNALEETHGERVRAAHILSIGRTTLYRKIKQYGLK